MNLGKKQDSKWRSSKLARLLFACIISSICVFVLSGASVFQYTITIDEDGSRTIVYTSEDSPEQVLKDQHIQLGAYDRLVVSESGNNERHIIIQRAYAVSVQADGKTQTAYLTQGTVADALSQLNITVGDDDYINVSLTEPVNADMNVVINRLTKQTTTTTTEIPFSVVKIPTRALPCGQTKTLSQGTVGIRTDTIAQTLLDNKVIDQKTLSSEETKKPVAARILIGSPAAPVSELVPPSSLVLDKNGNPVSYKKKISGRATAYSACGRRTNLMPGCIAMDLSRFPKGTRLYIKTSTGSYVYGYSQVRDTGTAVTNGTCLADLFFNSYQESCRFGVKNVDIYIL